MMSDQGKDELVFARCSFCEDGFAVPKSHLVYTTNGKWLCSVCRNIPAKTRDRIQSSVEMIPFFLAVASGVHPEFGSLHKLRHNGRASYDDALKDLPSLLQQASARGLRQVVGQVEKYYFIPVGSAEAPPSVPVE